MRWLDALERRFGRWTIPNFPLFIAGANGTIYILSRIQPGFADRLILIPEAVYHGEWWRLITFLFVPQLDTSPLFILFWLYLLYYYAQALENEWGEFRFCVFYIVGALSSIIGAFFIAHSGFSNFWLNTTFFLAFATLFPDFQLLLLFIIPAKVKYIGWFFWALMLFSFITGTFVDRVAIGSSLVNYLLFFGPGLLSGAKMRWDVYRNRRRFRSPD